MNVWNIAIIPIIVPLILRGIKIVSSENGKLGTVRMPKTFLLFSVACLCIDILAIILSFVFPEKGILKLIIFLLPILSLFSLTIFASLHISYDEEGFTVSRLFQKRVFFLYSDIIGLIPGARGSMTICTRKGKIYIDDFAVGGEMFICFAEDRYSEINGTFCLKDIRPGIFNGNVKDPLSFVVVYVMVAVLSLGAALYCTLSPIKQFSRDELVRETVTFYSATKKSESYILNDGRYFEIWEKTIVGSLDSELLQDVQIGKSFLISYEHNGDFSEETPCRIVELMRNDGTYIVTVDSSNDAYYHNYFTVIALLWSIFALLMLSGAWDYYVLCNPERHPKWANLLVKEEYRNW